MTWAVASSRYWHEVGQHHAGSRDTLRAMDWLTRQIGGSTSIHEITTGKVAELIARRRGERKPAKSAAKRTLLAPATVNRSVTEPLRKVLRRAERVWEAVVPRIEWTDLRLAEPQERVRELSGDEERRLFAALRPDYLPAVRFALLSGCRLSEVVGLTWANVDWGSRTITVHGKGGKIAPIPLTSDLRKLLFPLQGHHPERVFTYVVAAGRDGRRRGEVRPITVSGLDTIVGRALARANIANFHFHDLRHTAATRVLRASGNLRAVQTMLRHSEVKTTLKYAHVTMDDVRSAMEATGRTQSRKSPGEDLAAPEETKPVQGDR